MDKRIVQVNGINIAVVHSNELIITDTASALDFMATIAYNDECDSIVLNKQAIVEDFFNLRSGIAGDILQKFVTYGKMLAVVGDFSIYTSKSLRNFIFECNRGNDIYFVEDEQTAIDKLSRIA